jgi:endogenous inhibitor of DNA gyrase (YacG/DUF329 family)
MIEQRLSFAETEVPCSTCGRMVLKAKSRQGRHARFCSDECKHAAKLRWQATWRVKNPHWSRDWGAPSTRRGGRSNLLRPA